MLRCIALDKRLSLGITAATILSPCLGNPRANDNIALRIAVPETLALVGFDDISFSDILARPLTTVSQPKEEMGRIAIELLMLGLEHPGAFHPEGRILKPRLKVRAT